MHASAVTLTYDDGPDPTWTPRILDALGVNDVRATFFVSAERAAAYPGVVREILDSGNDVQFHCSQHLRHTEAPRETIAADTAEGLRTLDDLGVEPRYWRPPWGVAAGWTGELADEFGLTLVGWTADSHDWRGDNVQQMLGAMRPALRPGAVVLMHDGLGPGARRWGCEETVALTEALIPYLRGLGCEPAPLDALGEVPVPRSAPSPEIPA